LFLHDERGARRALTRNASGKYGAKRQMGRNIRLTNSLNGPGANLKLQSERNLCARWCRIFCCRRLLTTGAQRKLPTLPKLPRSTGFCIARYPDPAARKSYLCEKHTWRSWIAMEFASRTFLRDRIMSSRGSGRISGSGNLGGVRTHNETFNTELDGLQEQLKRVDPTLADAWKKGDERSTIRLTAYAPGLTGLR
jgi:hypothetical protein